MKRNITKLRADWIRDHAVEIKAIIADIYDNQAIEFSGPRGGSNAARIKGWSSGGWGWWVKAFRMAHVCCPAIDYWSGWAPTPSTAIPQAVAQYINLNAGSLVTA